MHRRRAGSSAEQEAGAVTFWSWGWLIIGAAALAWELLAIWKAPKHGTATAHTRKFLRRSSLIYFICLGLVAWFAVHMFGFGLVDGWIRGG